MLITGYTFQSAFGIPCLHPPPPPIQSLPSGRSGRGGDFNCGYRTLHGSLPVSEPSLQWVRACFSDIGSSPSLQAAFNGPLLSFIAGAEIVFHVMPVNSAAGKGNCISILLFFVRKINFFLLSVSIFASHNTCFFRLELKVKASMLHLQNVCGLRRYLGFGWRQESL